MNAEELKLAAAIHADHYVKLSSKAKREAAERLEDLGHVLLYENDGDLYAKAKGRDNYDKLGELAKG